MREIKFRAWTGNEMLIVGELTLFMDGHFNVNDEFPISQGDLMQYTGLKDKNGKEIYEGDITSRGVITFSRGKFQGTYFDSKGNLEEDWEDDLYLNKDIEIIGNIYENQELLSSN